VITSEQIEAERAFYDSFNSGTFDIERWLTKFYHGLGGYGSKELFQGFSHRQTLFYDEHAPEKKMRCDAFYVNKR